MIKVMKMRENNFCDPSLFLAPGLFCFLQKGSIKLSSVHLTFTFQFVLQNYFEWRLEFQNLTLPAFRGFLISDMDLHIM